jgi:hypothetical protein
MDDATREVVFVYQAIEQATPVSLVTTKRLSSYNAIGLLEQPRVRQTHSIGQPDLGPKVQEDELS